MIRRGDRRTLAFFPPWRLSLSSFSPLRECRVRHGGYTLGAMGKDKRKSLRGLARKADKFELYQKAVQSPDVEIPFFQRAFKKRFGRSPEVLREDFCGTAAVCCEWVRSKKNRRAFGVDLDPDPLEWGRRHNLSKLPKKAQSRVQLLRGDVRETTGPKADVIAAQNFSFFTFKTRKELRGYFEAALSNLAPEGILALDMMGGSQSQEEEHIEKRKVGKSQYIWEQRRFDPITHSCKNYIHFRFRDGSELRRAFTYDWRLWTLPEVQELLVEAGFDDAMVYWEGTDKKTGDGNGEFSPRKHAPADPAWIAYVVATKRPPRQPLEEGARQEEAPSP